MSKSLDMVFTTEQGKKVTYRLNSVKDSVTKDEVLAIMNTMITKNIFSNTSGDLKSVVSASITDKNVTDLAIM